MFDAPSNNASGIPALRYDPERDLAWLLVRPWIWIPRIFEIITSLSILTIRMLLQGSSNNEKVHQSLARNLLETLTNLGPCFIKVGQALSTRPDLVRRDWLEELTNLQDNLPPFEHHKALKTIQEELGAPAKQIFEEFPDHPIASASLGQVYKARLQADYWVAVKIQRPNLPFILRRDLVIIKLLGIVTSPILPLNLGFSLSEIIDEFGKTLFEEIDYELEASNAERFSNLFSKNPTIYVPRVERLVSSRKVLTTSWVEGTKLKDSQELRAIGLDPSALIKTAVISGIQQLLEFGYFHADPHPGNIFALEGKTSDLGHMAYIDFGMMDSISNEDRVTLTKAIVHLINSDFNLLAKAFQKLGFLSAEESLDVISPVLKEVLGEALDEEVANFNFKAITDKFSELMFDYPFRVPARFALIIRAVVSQEGLALKLDPNFKIIAVAYPYVARRLLSGETKEMLDILLDVIFDKKGGIRLDRIENLLDVLTNDSSASDSTLLPVAGAGLKLLLSPDGSMLRRNLLMTMIKDERLNTSDIKGLLKLLRSKFKTKEIAEDLIRYLNPLAA
ncbi:AarF/ABC1/UbiB kinase family protein [Prochlorococcus sp. MIT 1307]|uniref:ABC1 kinase family protein n=1 Tax=Prochlorococcus sp. MIT 1307 TaxID=3096219 RepID=UPI002A750A5E|nr:AarF/ABC1/UbiB kinase family protein [Prochlorococcus sp. MIT 1307]